MIRVGVIGVGFGQQVHVPAFRADRRCEVVAIAASAPARAQAAAGKLGIEKAFGGWRDMVDDQEIDAISIATPPSLQAEVALAAMGRRKAVLCEKPLAGSVDAACAMSAAADRSGLANMVDFEFLEIEEWRRAKALIDGGGLGAVRHVAVTWNVETYANRMKLDSWKTRTEDGGGTLNNFVSHTFCYLEWIVGPIREISARLFRAPDDGRTGDTFDALVLQFESGAAGTVSVSTDACPGSGHRVEFYGDLGAVQLENTTPDYVSGFRLLQGTRHSGRMEAIGETTAVAGIDGRVRVVSRIVSRFLDWIDEGVASTPNFRDGLRVQQLLAAAHKSSEVGGQVEVVRRIEAGHL